MIFSPLRRITEWLHHCGFLLGYERKTNTVFCVLFVESIPGQAPIPLQSSWLYRHHPPDGFVGAAFNTSEPECAGNGMQVVVSQYLDL